MSDCPQREMTLDEWMAKLPSSHTATIELAALRSALMIAQPHADEHYSMCARIWTAIKDVKVADPLMPCDVVMARELAALRAEIDLSRMQAAAVMTASIQNTETSIKDRIGRESPYWTQCYGDVCTAVDREMKLRTERDALVGALQVTQNRLSALGFAVPEVDEAIDAARSSEGKGATL